MTDPMNIVLGLPGLFIACIQCFEIIQYGRSFEDEHRRLVLRLEILEARLARWGHCVGILDGNPSLDASNVKEKLVVHLNNIKDQFEMAKQKAANSSPDKYMRKDENSTRATVRNAVRQWTTKYTKKCKIGGIRFQWAIYDRRTLETILVNIRMHIDDLFDVFPSDEKDKLLTAQQKLQEEEVKDLEPQALHMLEDLAEDYDETMVKAIKHVIKNRTVGSHIYGGQWDIRSDDKDFKHRSGDDVARGATGYGHTYTGVYKIGGSGTSSFGNNYA